MMRFDEVIQVRWARQLCLWLPCVLAACAQPEDKIVEVAAPYIEVHGPTLIAVGQSATLHAETVGDQEEDYAWTSSDDDVATVDEAGVVTAAAPGEATITAEGAESGLSGSHTVAVVAEMMDAGPDAGPGPGPDAGPDIRQDVPHYFEWLSSGHADATAEAFSHWDADGEVETECARCHSGDGFLDYVGADGSAKNSVEKPGSTDAVIDCQTCHDPGVEALSDVTFPSKVTVDGLGVEARCMTCHQGRASGSDVDEAITLADVGDDETSDELHFLNIHYYAAGATLYAGKVGGGYQYDGETYDHRFRHVPGRETCVGCHDPHTLQIRIEVCADCHAGVEKVSDLHDIRMMASLAQDYDGDGNLEEGIWHELNGVRAKLLRAMQAYPSAVGTSKICYDEKAYPYFFVDGDGDGKCSADEAQYAGAYGDWTPRLLRAAYNYQVSTKDPGAFAHNAKYIIQLLHDSIVDIDEVAAVGFDVSKLVRNDVGHFNGAGEPARHWDEDDEVSASCSRCHGGDKGLRGFVKLGVSVPVEEPDNGLSCATCHDSFGLVGQQGAYSTAEVTELSYPSGITEEVDPKPSNLCRTCHVGREAGSTVQATIDSGKLRFRNVHYLPAASLKKGSDVGLGYEWDGKTYAGPWVHGQNDECTSCHMPEATKHTFLASDAFDAKCATCHGDAGDSDSIRNLHLLDYDNDGDETEPLADEIATLADALLAQMQLIGLGNGTPLCYDGHTYPYFIADTNSSGTCDAGERSGFDDWTPLLLAASHNYQISQKEPGAWAHNFDYMAQLLIDSIDALGGDVGDYVRPAP